MSCSHEHHGHGGHEHHHHDDDDHLLIEGPQDYIYSDIDREGVSALNEAERDMGPRVIKPWSERLSRESYLVSDDDVDDSLLIRIPFINSASLKLRTLMLLAGPADETPDEVHLFVNADPPLDFADATERSELPKTNKLAPVQTLSVAQTNQVVEYPLRATKFSGVRDITLFIPRSQGGDRSRVYFVGLKGESSRFNRQAPANLVYEATPQLKDHPKLPGTEGASQNLGQ